MVDEGKVSTLQEMLTEEFTNTVCSSLRKVMLGESSQRKEGINTNKTLKTNILLSKIVKVEVRSVGESPVYRDYCHILLLLQVVKMDRKNSTHHTIKKYCSTIAYALQYIEG